jgi:hypothetical protein
MDDAVIEGQLTVEDILAEAEQASYHTILEVWSKVLDPAAEERRKPVTPQWASRIVNTYPQVDYADMVVYRDLYFERVEALEAILQAAIDSDEECLKHTSAEEDVEKNGHLYLGILFDWQKQFMLWELEWDCTRATAAIEVAATSELHRMFFAQEGLTALLDQINFEFTDEDRDALAEALVELREGFGE